jgi:Flp pilus assembly protein TadB
VTVTVTGPYASLFFDLSSWALGVVLFGIVLGATVIGLFVGRRLRHLSDSLKEPFAVLQAALLGVVGLLLAFGLALAVDRYESRRAALVEEANAIGTTYLRAQTLLEPGRARSLNLLARYTDSSIHLSKAIPGSDSAKAAEADGEQLQRRLWTIAGRQLAAAPVASAQRLYVETLNEMIDSDTVRLSALNNRVPAAVLFLEVAGAALALGLLAAYLAILGRAVVAAVLAALLVSMLLLVTCDLDRPTRGLIRVPATTLENLRASMDQPPAAQAPRSP